MSAPPTWLTRPAALPAPATPPIASGALPQDRRRSGLGWGLAAGCLVGCGLQFAAPPLLAGLAAGATCLVVGLAARQGSRLRSLPTEARALGLDALWMAGQLALPVLWRAGSRMEQVAAGHLARLGERLGGGDPLLARRRAPTRHGLWEAVSRLGRGLSHTAAGLLAILVDERGEAQLRVAREGDPQRAWEAARVMTREGRPGELAKLWLLSRFDPAWPLPLPGGTGQDEAGFVQALRACERRASEAGLLDPVDDAAVREAFALAEALSEQAILSAAVGLGEPTAATPAADQAASATAPGSPEAPAPRARARRL